MTDTFSNSDDFPAGGEEEDGGFSLRDIFFVLFRHKDTVMCIAGVCFVAALVTSLFFVKRQYTSEAKLLVRIGRESVAVDRTAAPGENIRTGRSREEEIGTEIEIIKSLALAKKVVDTFGVDKLLQLLEIEHPVTGKKSPIKRVQNYISQYIGNSESDPDTMRNILREKLAGGLMKSLQVNRVRNSSMFAVTFSANRSEAASQILNVFIEKYLDEHINLHFTDSTYMFLKEQTGKLRSQLSNTEEKLKNYKNKLGGAYNEQHISDRVESLEQQLRETESELASAEGTVSVLRQRLPNNPAAQNADGGNTADVSFADDIHSRLNDLKLQEQDMLSLFTEQSIPVRELRRQISEMQDLLRIEREAGTVVSPANQTQIDALQWQFVEAESTLTSLRTKTVVLQKQRKEAKALMTEFNNSSAELATLLRDKEKYEISYRKYAESSEQARIDEALKLEKISNISIAQAPTRPLDADKTKKRIILLGGLIGGLIAAIVMAYLLENMDNTLKRPEDIKKKLSIPVLASVPCFDATGEQKKQNIFNIANLDVLPKPSKSDSACAGNEQENVYYEELIGKLFEKEDSSLSGQLVVAITSSRAGEGVSTIATCLATNLTRRGRVLMVDMDAFKQQGGNFVSLYNDLNNIVALNNGLQPCGKSILPANAETSGNNGFEIVDEIQGIRNKAYNFVILALPPVLDDSRASTLAKLADQAILVIEAERVRWQVLKSVCEKLTDAGVVIKGSILNKRKYYIPTWLYRKL